MSTALQRAPTDPVPAPSGDWMEKRSERSVARLLQHSILQLCNEHVGYSHRLQILGVLCMTVDDEQHELVVKVNNTLKRVNPVNTNNTVYAASTTPQPNEDKTPHPTDKTSTDHNTPATEGGNEPNDQMTTTMTEGTTRLTDGVTSPVMAPLTNGRRSHGRKGSNPVKVHHVYDAGEDADYDEDDDDIVTVMPTDPESSLSSVLIPQPPAYHQVCPEDEDDDDDDIEDEDDDRDEKRRTTYQLRVPQVATYNDTTSRPQCLELPLVLPSGDVANYSRQSAFLSSGETALDYSRKSAAEGVESPATPPVKSETITEYNYGGLPAYTPSYVHSLLETCRLPGGAGTSAVLPISYASSYTHYTPDPKPMTAMDRVKDIILYDERTPVHLQKGARIVESDYMVDKLGVEGRKRRRRAPDESLTAEEIAEYMGKPAAGELAAGSGLFRCQSCGDESNDLTRYLRHTLSTHNAYVCHECGKSFTTKSSLLRHRPIHTGMRRFACGICRKAFYRKDKCKAHIKRHLGGASNSSSIATATTASSNKTSTGKNITSHYQKILPIA